MVDTYQIVDNEVNTTIEREGIIIAYVPFDCTASREMVRLANKAANLEDTEPQAVS